MAADTAERRPALKRVAPDPRMAHVRGVGWFDHHRARAPIQSAWSDFVRLFAAGSGAAVITKVCVAPLERAKFLIQLSALGRAPDDYRTTFRTMHRVLRTDGPLALFRGCGANVLRTFPAYGLQFALSDSFRVAVAEQGQRLDRLRVEQVFVATTAAGALQTTVTHPLEQLRLRLYVGAEIADSPARSIGSCVRMTYRMEGLYGFYRGYFVGLVSGAPFVGCQLTTHDMLWRHCPGRDAPPEQSQRALWQFLCGAAAGVGTQTLLYPLDSLWRRMMADGAWGQKRKYGSSFNCAAIVLRQEGIRGAWAGAGANALRAIPAAGIQFVAYDALKNIFAAAS